MTHKDKIATIFSLFRDATIVRAEGDLTNLTLEMECPYLAQMINPAFKYFYLALQDITKVEFAPWGGKKSAAKQHIIGDIFSQALEINEVSEMENEIINILCYVQDKEYEGGDLSIKCQDVQVYDQAQSAISLNDLAYLVKQYWQNI